jgi:putative inorganic carbon (HCO3(-)) transporter
MDGNIRKRRRAFEKNKRKMGLGHQGRRRNDVLSSREKWISTWASLQIIFLAWNLGSMHIWAQWSNLGLAVMGLFGLLIPDNTALQRQGFQGIGRLFTSPMFWFGGILMAYIGIQCVNFSHRFERSIQEITIQEVMEEGVIAEIAPLDGETIVKEENENIVELKPPVSQTGGKPWHILPWKQKYALFPASVEAPFEQMNAARVLLMYSPVLIWGCVLTLGVERRRGLRRILWSAVLGGAAMALFGAIQRLTGAKAIYWYVETSNPAFFGSFIYPNHGAAFLYLLLGVTLGLALYHHQRSEQEFLRSGPHYFLGFLGMLLMLGLVFSKSRAGIVLGAGVSLIGGAVIILRLFGKGQDMRQGMVLGILCVVGIGFLGYSMMNFTDIGGILMDFESLKAANSPSLETRLKLQEATWEAFVNNKWYGTGAGSFQYRFPLVQSSYPELGGVGQKFYDHAHNDYLQVLMEYGLIGAFLISGYFLCLIWGALKSLLLRPSMLVCFLAGLCALALHSWWDFPGYCPSVLILAVFILAIMGRWGEAERIKLRIDND